MLFYSIVILSILDIRPAEGNVVNSTVVRNLKLAAAGTVLAVIIMGLAIMTTPTLGGAPATMPSSAPTTTTSPGAPASNDGLSVKTQGTCATGGITLITQGFTPEHLYRATVKDPFGVDYAFLPNGGNVQTDANGAFDWLWDCKGPGGYGGVTGTYTLTLIDTTSPSVTTTTFVVFVPDPIPSTSAEN